MRLKNIIPFILFIFIAVISVFSEEVYQKQEILQASWGAAPGQFGLQQGLELETVGPLTFTRDNIGNIYLYDFIHERIQKFSNQGKYLETIGSRLVCSSFCVDESGKIYLLDVYANTVRCYSPKGELLREIKIADAIQLVEGYAQNIFIDAENNLVVNRVDQRVHPLATVGSKEISLLSAEAQMHSEKTGYLGKADKNRYQMQWRNKHQADILVANSANNLVSTISITTPDEFGAVLFLGQDATGNIYTEVERTDPNTILHLEVRKFNPDGKLIAIIEVPNNYFSTVYKKLEIDVAGNIYQMHITQQGVRVIKYYK